MTDEVRAISIARLAARARARRAANRAPLQVAPGDLRAAQISRWAFYVATGVSVISSLLMVAMTLAAAGWL